MKNSTRSKSGTGCSRERPYISVATKSLLLTSISRLVSIAMINFRRGIRTSRQWLAASGRRRPRWTTPALRTHALGHFVSPCGLRSPWPVAQDVDPTACNAASPALPRMRTGFSRSPSLADSIAIATEASVLSYACAVPGFCTGLWRGVFGGSIACTGRQTALECSRRAALEEPSGLRQICWEQAVVSVGDESE